MSAPSDSGALTDELAALRRRVDEQAAELAELRESQERGPLSRRGLLMGLAGAGAAGLATVAGARPASAADHDALKLGEDTNAATSPTKVTMTSSGGFDEFGLDLRGNGRATLAVAGELNPDFEHLRYAIWADMQSVEFGDAAIRADAKNGFAIEGHSLSSFFPAVVGIAEGGGAGLGAGSATGGPQLYLEAVGHPAGPPATGTHAHGSMRFDINSDLWILTDEGPPGVWTRFLREDTAQGRVVPMTPFRALDTRASGGRPAGAPVVPGQKHGPLTGGETVTLDLSGAGPLPDAMSGIVGNVTVITPSYTGYLRVMPEGATSPASSTNFAKGTTVSNAFTSSLAAPDGSLSALASGSSSQTYHLVIDIAAYIT